MKQLIGLCEVAKIIRTVITSISIDMIYCHFVLAWANECFRYKATHPRCSNDSIFGQSNYSIAFTCDKNLTKPIRYTSRYGFTFSVDCPEDSRPTNTIFITDYMKWDASFPQFLHIGNVGKRKFSQSSNPSYSPEIADLIKPSVFSYWLPYLFHTWSIA